MEKVDVLVIGAGLLGCFTARNLARYEMDILVLEKESDVSRGISKANTGIIYSGYDNRPGTLKSRLCIQANETFDTLAEQLGVPFKRPGSLMIGFGPRADRVISRKYHDGISAGMPAVSLLHSIRKVPEPSTHGSFASPRMRMPEIMAHISVLTQKYIV